MADVLFSSSKSKESGFFVSFSMNLVPVEKGELSLGKPLPWTIYDQNQNPLMSQGEIINSDEYLESILAKNPLHELALEMDLPGPDSGLNSQLDSSSIAEPSKIGESILKFQELSLKVGDRLQLEPPAQLKAGRCIVRVLGYLENVSLLVTAPFENGIYLPLLEDEAVFIRGFSRRCAFGFSSSVRRVCKLPFNYLHLSFPEEVRGTIIRKSPRVKTRIITTITAMDGVEVSPQTGTITNLSSTGAQLTVKKQLGEVGKKVKLAFRVNLHNMDAYLTTSGTIRRIFSEEEKKALDSQVSYGIEFSDLQPNDRIILQSLIYQQMIESPHSLI